MPHFRNLRFGNSGFEFKDGHKALTIKVFSAILSLTEAQPSHIYLRNAGFGNNRFRNLRCFFHRLMQEEFFQHTIPIIPRISYGRMVHRHRLHTSAVVQEISARRRTAPVHYYRLAVLPSLARHLIPKALAPNDDILGLILVERLAYLRRHNACRRRAERICCLP